MQEVVNLFSRRCGHSKLSKGGGICISGTPLQAKILLAAKGNLMETEGSFLYKECTFHFAEVLEICEVQRRGFEGSRKILSFC